MAVDKMVKARAALVLGHPFWGALALRTRMMIDEKCPTAWTNGKVIGYNPKFIEKLPLEKVEGLLCHELLHKMFFHHLRRGDRDSQKWNIACDFAINEIVQKTSGVSLPDGGMIDPKYAGMGAEAIYTQLKADPKGDKSNSDPGGNGEVRDADPEDGTQAQQEARVKQEIAGALHAAKMQGKVPAGMERLVEELLEPQVPWKDVLRRFCTERAPEDYSWSRPNRRMISQGFYFPAIHSEDACGTIVVGIDTSGSIGQHELSVFGSELGAILADVMPRKTYVLYCDAAVAHVDEFARGEALELNPHGGGGTDFNPVFKWIEEEGVEPKCVVYLTDGYGSFPPDNLPYPVLWCITSEVEAPMGETLKVDL